jgi:hypothetical protein
VANTLTYYDMAKITTAKSFIIQASGKEVDKASTISSFLRVYKSIKSIN